jgi:hypothetical protein
VKVLDFGLAKAMDPGAGGSSGSGGLESGETLKARTARVMASLPPDIIAIDAMPDRQKWLALVPQHAGSGVVTVVQNWRAGLKQ